MWHCTLLEQTGCSVSSLNIKKSFKLLRILVFQNPKIYTKSRWFSREKKNWNSQFFQKTNETWKKNCPESSQDSLSFVFWKNWKFLKLLVRFIDSHDCFTIPLLPPTYFVLLTLFWPDLVKWRSYKGWFRPWLVGIGLNLWQWPC